MAIMRSEAWAELLEPILFDVFTNHTAKLPDYRSKIFNVLSSKKAVETALGRGSIGMMQEWTSTGRKVHYDEIQKGFKVVFEHKKYSNGIEIDRDLVDDDQYDEIISMAQDLSFSAYYTQQYHAASVFNNAFDTGHLGGDGKPLCAVDHPLVPGGTVTIKNAGDYDLTADNLEKVRTEIAGWTDDRGNIIPSNFDTLLVPPALRKAALVIADSDKEPETDKNNVNIWKGRVQVIEWPMLTDPTVWFFIDSQRAKRDLIWWNRRVPKLERDMPAPSFDDEIYRWKTVGRWSYGWKTPLWVYGCKASTTP